MEQPDPQAVLAAAFLIVLGVWTILVVWTFLRSRRRIARKIVPFERRRPVPWGGLEVVLLLGTFVASPALVAYVSVHLLDFKVPEAGAATSAQSPDKQAAGERETPHPVAQLLEKEHSTWVIVVSALMVVLVAPVVEEFMFRVLFQGWLEKIENRYRRRLPGLRVLPGAAPVLLASVFFAAMHVRPPEQRLASDLILFLLICQTVASLVILPLAILVLRVGCGATWADMGVVPAHILHDAGVGLLACLAFTGPIYLLFIGARLVVPEGLVPDPIALVPLAVVLGTLYYRTHRVVAPIVMHMTFNAAGMAMALLTVSSP